MVKGKQRERTLSVHWQIEVLNLAILAKDLAQVVFVDVLCEALDNNLRREAVSSCSQDFPIG